MNTLDGKSDFDRLEEITKSLKKERSFFDQLSPTKPSYLVANKILILIGSYPEFSFRILLYLREKNSKLFNYQPSKTVVILGNLLEEIFRNARLSVYLALRGIFPQALSILRVCIELIGIYTHVWKEPQKAKFVWYSDSKEHANAFRYPPDRRSDKEFKEEEDQISLYTLSLCRSTFSPL